MERFALAMLPYFVFFRQPAAAAALAAAAVLLLAPGFAPRGSAAATGTAVRRAAPVPFRVVEEMVLVRDGQTQPATTATVYVKDDMIRRDQATGLSTILDLTSDITFLVDHRNRTCATIPNKSIAARRSNFNAMLSANTNLSSTADVKPLGQTRVIAGKPAKGYKFATTIKASQKGNDANRVTIQISGEQWVSES
jgi:hypothetical protein